MALGNPLPRSYTEWNEIIRRSRDMSNNYPFMSMEEPCEEAITWVIQQMSTAGLFVVRTFDLKVARLPQTDCPCPHHGTGQCDCQLSILLVYGSDQEPISLIVHGYEGKTWFSVVDTPQQHADSNLARIIQQSLVNQILPGLDPSKLSQAIRRTV